MNKILFIDTLTTGLNPEFCDIYRIGGIFCEETPAQLTEKQRFDIHIRPRDNARITDSSLWISGTTRSQLIYYPEREEAFNNFMELIKENVNLRNMKDKIYISGFGVSAFDVPFLIKWFERSGNQRFRDCFHMQTFDLMSLSAFALKNERQNMPDFHLETAAKFLGATPVKGEYYNCLDNAMTCLETYLRIDSRLNNGPTKQHTATDSIFTNHNQKK